MSINLKTQKLLKETEDLIQDIECELHFRLPHSKKLADIRNMVLWLKGGDPITTYDFSLQEQELSGLKLWWSFYLSLKANFT